MARLRTAHKLLEHSLPPQSPWEAIIWLLQNLGRLTYKNLFFFIKICTKSSYYAFYTIYFAFLYLIKFFVKTITNIWQLIKNIFLQTKKIKLPSLPSLPKPKPLILPHAVLPKIRGPKIQIDLSKRNLSFIFVLITVVTISFYFYFNILKDLPSPDKLITRDQVVSTKIYDRQNRLLFTLFNGNQNRTLIKFNEMPNFVKQATIATEDKEFYKHPGFSLRGIIRALWRNIFNSQVEGGSTITQQLVKNALLTPERTWQRKIKEVLLSIQVELIFTKDEILQMYFNEVPFGGTAYGIEEASQTYLGKNIKEVNLAQGALLAGLPAAPTKYSPFGANPKLAIERQHQVLDAMVQEGYINNQEAQEAKQQKIVLAPQTTNIKAPHFVMYIKDLLVEKYGIKTVEQGGLHVITSLDLDLQEMAQQAVSDEVDKLSNMHVTNGAAVITDPKTGEVLAMVGSRDYFDQEKDGNVNVTTSLRQIGSAIKPVTYALALSNGYTPATIIPDTPITYKIPGTDPYTPVNYDGKFHGNVTLRTALGSSYNIPAVKTLAVFGVNKMIDLAQSMGITTWNDRTRFGLSLTLGAGEVKMTDMTVVFGTLANLGSRINLKPITKVTDYTGKVLEGLNEQPSQRVLDTKVAYLLTDILKDNSARTPAFGPSSYLIIPNHEVAVKTGTTNDKRDNWTIGYTNDYLVAVWVGNNDNTPMNAVASGITGASPIWHNIMISLLKDKEPQAFQRPDNLLKIRVCVINGLLPCEGCPTVEEYFVSGTEPKYACNSEEIKKILEEQEKAKQDKILQGATTTR